jgi:hypothetical protein
VQLKRKLSLYFKHEEFCDELYIHRKTLTFTVFVGSGALLEGRVALGLAREAPFGRPGERPQGFGGLAGVPSSAKSAETTRWTRTGVRGPVS